MREGDSMNAIRVKILMKKGDSMRERGSMRIEDSMREGDSTGEGYSCLF